MTDNVREKLEAAYRKLPILPEREARLVNFIESIEPGAEKTEPRPKRVRKKGVDKVREDLETLALRARDLISDLEDMHHSTKIALATHRFGGKADVQRLVSELDRLKDAAQDASKGDLAFEASEKPIKQSVLIASLLHWHYEELTGHAPPQTRTTNGSFYNLVAEVLDTLSVEGSVENAVREACKPGS
ncbi:MAG: hypothetical protein ACRYGP_16605 [Janthinobacterium lividum]